MKLLQGNHAKHIFPGVGNIERYEKSNATLHVSSRHNDSRHASVETAKNNMCKEIKMTKYLKNSFEYVLLFYEISELFKLFSLLILIFYTLSKFGYKFSPIHIYIPYHKDYFSYHSLYLYLYSNKS